MSDEQEDQGYPIYMDFLNLYIKINKSFKSNLMVMKKMMMKQMMMK